MLKSEVDSENNNPDSLEYSGILPCEGRNGGFYPNVDISIWLRKVFSIVNNCFLILIMNISGHVRKKILSQFWGEGIYLISKIQFFNF